jgi:2TM domain
VVTGAQKRGVAVPIQQTTTEKPAPAVVDSSLVLASDERLRELALAVEQIGRKRRFHMRAFAAAAVMVMLVIVWAISEYHNAGGWPTSGFSQSPSIPHKWNSWIIYPLIFLSLGVAIDASHTYRHRPITEEQIRREMDHLRGAR